MKRWTALQNEIASCQRCPRLREHCRAMGEVKRRAFAAENYWARPVPNFGVCPAGLLIVGLAPAAHGANRTGRMFTGDRSGQWLYRALCKAGFANQPTWERADDGLTLINCVITATCHCAPPDNKPLPEEIGNCRPFLTRTFELAQPRVVLALGQIAWRAALAEARQLGWHSGRVPKFAHLAKVPLAGGRWLLGSYHPSQQNTFTGKLTEAMFDAVFEEARRLLKIKSPATSVPANCGG